MLAYTCDIYGRYVFAGFSEIRITAITPGEAWAKLLALGKYFSE